jgi:hypothetical protein
MFGIVLVSSFLYLPRAGRFVNTTIQSMLDPDWIAGNPRSSEWFLFTNSSSAPN